MSKMKDELDIDILRFLEQVETQNQNDRIQTLRNLLDKYIHLSKCDLLMDYHDLNSIVSHAKDLIANGKAPVHLGSRKRLVPPGELGNLFVIESTIMHLNKKDCLKKIPKFDYRENKI